MPTPTPSPPPDAPHEPPPPLPPETLEIEVFRSGDYGPKGNYTNDDLDAIIADYNAATGHEAPLKLDHVQDGPAHGWVAGLRRQGDALVAKLVQLSIAARQALASGAFKKPSIELFPPEAPNDKPRLRAIALLGADIPEVKGLAAPVFSEIETPVATRAIESLRARGRYRADWDAAGVPAFLAWLGNIAPGAPTFFHAAQPSDPVAWFAQFLAQQSIAALCGEHAPTAFRQDRRDERHLHAATRTPIDPMSAERHRVAERLRAGDASLPYAEALRLAAGQSPTHFPA